MPPALFADEIYSTRCFVEFDLDFNVILAAIPGVYSVGPPDFGMNILFFPEVYNVASAVALFIAKLLYIFSSFACLTRLAELRP